MIPLPKTGTFSHNLYQLNSTQTQLTKLSVANVIKTFRHGMFAAVKTMKKYLHWQNSYHRHGTNNKNLASNIFKNTEGNFIVVLILCIVLAFGVYNAPPTITHTTYNIFDNVCINSHLDAITLSGYSTCIWHCKCYFAIMYFSHFKWQTEEKSKREKKRKKNVDVNSTIDSTFRWGTNEFTFKCSI